MKKCQAELSTKIDEKLQKSTHDVNESHKHLEIAKVIMTENSEHLKEATSKLDILGRMIED